MKTIVGIIFILGSEFLLTAQEPMNMSNGTHHQVEMSGHGEMSRQTEDSTVFVQKGKTIRYDLYVTDTVVNFTGKKKHAYAINGSLPAPTLTFTEGDTAEIYLHNQLKQWKDLC